jgi:glycerophosphoryl diester phosphodiesterase
MDAGKYKGEEWSYTRIPTLSEIFKMIPEYGEIFIEPKQTGVELLEKICQVFASTALRQEQLTFLVGYADQIATLRKIVPKATILWGMANWIGDWDGEHTGPRFTPEEMVAEARRLGVDGVDIHTQFIAREYVDAMHKDGLTFNVWVVDDPKEAAMYQEWGVDSITSNRVYALQQELKEILSC